MKHLVSIIVLIVCGFISELCGQTAIPYYNNFDNPNDTVGWTHYAISGLDDWELGIPNDDTFSSAYSPENAWATNLDGSYAGNSERVLETPSFDLSDTSIHYALSFFQKKESYAAGAYFYLEYSSDNGSTWQLLDDVNANKRNWQGSTGFSGADFNFISFTKSAIDLSFIQGQDSVKFRFRFVSNTVYGEGWMIDNFKIDEQIFNFYATEGDSIFVTQNCSDFEVNSTLGFNNQYFNNVYNTTNYYLSSDSILDSFDSLIATEESYINYTESDWVQNIVMPVNLNAGYYYVIYEHEALDVFYENDETDNVGSSVLKVDSIFTIPYVEDFETDAEPWEPNLAYDTNIPVWELGEGYRHHLEGAHSGAKSWHTSKSIDLNLTGCDYSCNVEHINSNFIDLTTGTDGLVLNLWFKNHIKNNSYTIEYSDGCDVYWNDLYTFPACRDDDWDFMNLSLDELASSNNFKFRITFEAIYLGAEGIMFDDVYIGAVKPDLSIERDKSNRFTSSALTSDTLKYYINNSGLSVSPETTSTFYWSTDSILDGNDVLLGTKEEAILTDTARVWTNFIYTKPTASVGKYYIFYVLDSADAVDEMREYNNTGYFTIYQENIVALPYFNDFESEAISWRHNASLGDDQWQLTAANGILLDTAFSGTQAWITNDTGPVAAMSRMHLYSPIFDLSETTNPVLEFDMKLDSDPNCSCSEGKMNMSYSTDGGATWNVLDTVNQSYSRWYYPIEYSTQSGLDIPSMNKTGVLFDLNENTFASIKDYNGRDTQRNTRYILDLGLFSGGPPVQFRYNLGTLTNHNQDANVDAVEGALIDNFSIKESFVDLNIDYKKSLMISSIADEIKFFMHIKNQGNYISSPSMVNYYISSDTILDGNDYYLGELNVPEIRPDMYYYVNEVFEAPTNLSDYQYLLYELDASDVNIESNEINNMGYWDLALDGISSYPYFNDFNDSIVDGWHQYSIHPFSSNIGNFRFRNMLAPKEVLYQTDLKSGEWFTERTPGSWVPEHHYYLETPTFNFSGIDSVFISFDLMCTGSTSIFDEDGGNLHFSIDGGNTWSILTSSYGSTYNWYNHTSLSGFYGEPGWTGPPEGYGIAVLDSTAFDASFLKGEEHVMFRFKYKSNSQYFGGGTVQGMRLDNFKVQGFTLDYITNDTMIPVSGTLTQPDFSINYTITNQGETNGAVTATNFYWSNDSIYDSDDPLIHTVTENGIASGSTYSSSTSITYPDLINQTEYYLFYITDGNMELEETDEYNNLGSYKVTFPPFHNYYANMECESLDVPTSQSAFDVVYSVINNGSLDGLNSTTAFYWSLDDVFDAGDQHIKDVSETLILSGDTLVSTTNIIYPSPTGQAIYYLFYTTDSNGEISELNEEDNVGCVKISFTNLNSNLSLFENMYMYTSENYLYVVTQEDLDENVFSLKITNVTGELVYHSAISIYEGENRFILPNNLSDGIYLIRLDNRAAILTRKVFIQH